MSALTTLVILIPPRQDPERSSSIVPGRHPPAGVLPRQHPETSSFKVKDLVAELKKRNVRITGVKDVLKRRLQEDDERSIIASGEDIPTPTNSGKFEV